MKYLFFSLVVIFNLQSVFSQTVEVPISKRRIAEIQKKDREDTQANKLYFGVEEKCRNLTGARSFVEAETSCRLAISYAEKLPKDRYLERSSAYESLAYVLLWQRKTDEAIPLLNKSLEIGKPVIDDTDAETGEIYFLLGQAYHQLGKLIEAREYYTKAETAYQTAFRKIDDDEIGGRYPKSIINILKAHLILLKNAGLNEEAAKVEKRLAETKIEFAKFLEN
ncbi:MAG TPA: tetratricopeptide repeat protein [Pyrinomonadaceae bacterium]|jgi:tetratricopeptide (TPR) repeat protein